MARERSGTVTPVNAFLKRFLSKSKAMDQVTLALAQRRWVEVVGHGMREYSYPEGYNSGKLTVNVSSSVWLQELVLNNAAIKKKLNGLGIDVYDVFYKIGKCIPLHTKATIEDEEESDSPLSSREKKKLEDFKKNRLGTLKSESLKKRFLAIRTLKMKKHPLK